MPTLTKCVPVGVKRRLYTQPGWACGSGEAVPAALAAVFKLGFTKSRTTVPSATFQILMVRSLPPEARSFPSGLNAAQKTPSRWPISEFFLVLPGMTDEAGRRTVGVSGEPSKPNVLAANTLGL